MFKSYDKSVKQIIPIRNGLGDNIVFNHVLPEVIHIYGEKAVVIGTAYPEVYINNIYASTMDVYESFLYEHKDRFNVYKFMFKNKWNKSLAEAYKEMLLRDEENSH
jgi:hypothetical protein